MIYNKLVRDRIPDIIQAEKKTVKTRVLTEEEYRVELTQKLQEEVAEYLQDRAPEELADIMEVLYALGRMQGTGPEELEKIRQDKAEKRGGFNERIFLLEVED